MEPVELASEPFKVLQETTILSLANNMKKRYNKSMVSIFQINHILIYISFSEQVSKLNINYQHDYYYFSKIFDQLSILQAHIENIHLNLKNNSSKKMNENFRSGCFKKEEYLHRILVQLIHCSLISSVWYPKCNFNLQRAEQHCTLIQ